MGKCFAYDEFWRNAIKYKRCDVLNHEAFVKVQRKGGCSEKTCAFYKEDKDMIRGEYGTHKMSRKQKATRELFKR